MADGRWELGRKAGIVPCFDRIDRMIRIAEKNASPRPALRGEGQGEGH